MDWVVRNWLILAVCLAALSTLASFLGEIGLRALGGTVLTLGWGAVASLAIVDGLRRLLGRPSLLGAERGLGRLLAAIQILLGTLILLNLL